MRIADVVGDVDAESERVVRIGEAMDADPGKAADFERALEELFEAAVTHMIEKNAPLVVGERVSGAAHLNPVDTQHPCRAGIDGDHDDPRADRDLPICRGV